VDVTWRTSRPLKIQEDSGRALHIKIANYKSELGKIDEDVLKEISAGFIIPQNLAEIVNVGEDRFARFFFENNNVIEALNTLTLIEGNVLACEKKLLEFCNLNANYISHGYDKISLLATQDVKRVGPRDQIQIVAGLGAFNSSIISKIFILDKLVPLDESGMARCKISASAKVGMHTIPIKIEYFHPISKTKYYETRVLDYFVIEK